jgi:curved DNA-binding protein
MGREPFVDYYEILEVSPGAGQETIERVYRLLAKRYHPDNKKTGDARKFDNLVKSFRILSDPEKRAGYDAIYESAKTQQWRLFMNSIPHDGAEGDRKIYQAILSILYLARRRDAENAGVGIFQLEKLLGLAENHLNFHIWYLREKGWIQRVENGGFAITASGVDVVLEKDILITQDRLLPTGEKVEE